MSGWTPGDPGKAGGAGMILAIVSASGFGTLPVLYKLAFSLGAATTGVLAWRFGLAALAILVYCRLARISLRVGRSTVFQVALLGGVGYGGLSWLYSMSLRFIPAWLGTMLFYIYPVATAVLAGPLLGERLDRAKVHAMLLSLSGCALVVWAPVLGGGSGRLNPWGVLMALAAGVGYAAYSVVARRIVASINPVVVSTYATLFSTAFYIVLALLSGDSWTPSGAGAWAVVGALALLATVIPMISLMRALDLVGATRTAILGTFEPLISAALALVFLGERLAWLQAAGGALIIASVFAVRKGMCSTTGDA